jgi:hypothetical protein
MSEMMPGIARGWGVGNPAFFHWNDAKRLTMLFNNVPATNVYFVIFYFVTYKTFTVSINLS